MKINTKTYNQFNNYLQTLLSEEVIDQKEYFTILGLNIEDDALTDEQIAQYTDFVELKGEVAGYTSIPESHWYKDWQGSFHTSTPIDSSSITLSSIKYAKFVAWLEREVDDNTIVDSIKHGVLGIDKGSLEDNEKYLSDIVYSHDSKVIPNTAIYQHYLEQQ